MVSQSSPRDTKGSAPTGTKEYHVFVNILLAFLLQILFTIGVIALGGFLIALCNRFFYANFGENARGVCYVTGALGTPVHELSHALFCLIFAHKIDEIQLFQINSEDGTLGYVSHSYNPKNIYQRIGNFFIGIAPIVVISGLLFLVAWLLMPNTVRIMVARISHISMRGGIGNVFTSYFSAMGAFFQAVTNYRWWIFILVGAFFALHMTLSGADIKGALSGLLLVVALFLIADVVLGLIGTDVLDAFTRAILIGGLFLSVILSVSLVINVILLLVSLLYRAIASKVR